MTLREAFQAFHGNNVALFEQREPLADARKFFAHHDMAHVVFGCDTSLVGEGKVKLWTLFGTNLGIWGHLRGYSEASAFALFKQYSLKHVVSNVFLVVKCAPMVIYRAATMSNKWPWSEYEQYLDLPLDQVRREFNIRCL